MKKLTRFLGIVCLTLCLMVTSKAKAWGTKTHYSLMSRALNIVSQSNPEARRFNNQKIDIDMLYKGVMEPIEKKYNSEYHYYHILTDYEEKTRQYDKLFVNKKTYETARTRLDYHYKKALKLYLAGELSESSLHLGSACHYLQDICCPSHTAIVDAKYNKTYEEYCEALASVPDYKPIIVHDSEVKRLSKDWDIVINSNAQKSAKYKHALLSREKKKWQDSFTDTFNLSQKQTAVLLIKFYQDIQKKEIVKEDAKVLTKNELEKALFYALNDVNKYSYSNDIDQEMFDMFVPYSRYTKEKDLDPLLLQNMFLTVSKK